MAKAGKVHRINKSSILKSETRDSMRIDDEESLDGKRSFNNEDGEEAIFIELGSAGVP